MLSKTLKKLPQCIKTPPFPLLLPRSYTRTPMLQIPRYAYFLQDMVNRKVSDTKSTILPSAMHLYIQKTLNSQFSERNFVYVVNQIDKIVGGHNDDIRQFIDFGYNNLHKIQQFKTTILMLNMAYRHRYDNPKVIQKIAKQSFKLLKQHNQLYKQKAKSFSQPVCKLFITSSKMIGLDKFTDQDFKAVKINNIKILFLVYILELFWREKLQDRFQFPDKLLKCIKDSEKYIPYSDLHHIEMVSKTIRHPQFVQIIANIKKRAKQNAVQPQSPSQSSQNLQQDLIQLQNQLQGVDLAPKKESNNRLFLKINNINSQTNNSQSEEDVDGELKPNQSNDMIIRQKKGQETRFGVQITALLYMEYLKDLRTKYL